MTAHEHTRLPHLLPKCGPSRHDVVRHRLPLAQQSLLVQHLRQGQQSSVVSEYRGGKGRRTLTPNSCVCNERFIRGTIHAGQALFHVGGLQLV